MSLKDIMEDSKLSWEGFEKFGTVQEILEHNKCDRTTVPCHPTHNPNPKPDRHLYSRPSIPGMEPRPGSTTQCCCSRR